MHNFLKIFVIKIIDVYVSEMIHEQHVTTKDDQKHNSFMLLKPHTQLMKTGTYYEGALSHRFVQEV